MKMTTIVHTLLICLAMLFMLPFMIIGFVSAIIQLGIKGGFGFFETWVSEW